MANVDDLFNLFEAGDNEEEDSGNVPIVVDEKSIEGKPAEVDICKKYPTRYLLIVRIIVNEMFFIAANPVERNGKTKLAMTTRKLQPRPTNGPKLSHSWMISSRSIHIFTEYFLKVNRSLSVVWTTLNPASRYTLFNRQKHAHMR